MSPQKRRPQARKGRTAAAARSGGRRTDRTALIAAIVIVAVGGTLVFAFASSAKNKAAAKAGDSKAPASLVSKLTSVPPSVYNSVGVGTSAPLPQKLPGPLLSTTAGKPRVIYVGAEFCPFCATERWSMVIALSRFGTFSDLQVTESNTTPETYPQTQTFSFHGSTYTSKYISFEPTETENNREAPLETPNSEVASLQTKYDAPPYVAAANANAIPFIDFGDEYLISGATYSPQVLQDKTHDQIADALSDPNSDISKGAIGAANAMTATICILTKDTPATVCTQPAVKTIEAQIKAQ